MEEKSTKGNFRAIIVGSLADSFVQYSMDLLDNYEIEFILCEDVYWAVGQLSKNNRKNALIIGRYEQLNREKGRFFEIASKADCICCCFTDSVSGFEQEQMSVLNKDRAFVVSNENDIEKEVLKLLAPNSSRSFERGKNGSSFNKNNFLTTQDELNALLGEQ